MGGADFVVDYTQGGWQKEVLKITGGRGADVVYDPVGRIKGAVLFYLATRGYLIMVLLILPLYVLRRCAEVYCVGWACARHWICRWRD